MTVEQAQTIRVWRIDYGCSWRIIAELFINDFGTEDDKHLYGNQLYGKDLCVEAAEILGENSEFLTKAINYVKSNK